MASDIFFFIIERKREVSTPSLEYKYLVKDGWPSDTEDILVVLIQGALINFH